MSQLDPVQIAAEFRLTSARKTTNPRGRPPEKAK